MKPLLLLAWMIASSWLCAAADIVLTDNGRSSFSICCPKNAPASVRRAAEELQRVIAVATGCSMPIRDGAASSMICLGDCPAAREAGVTVELLADEWFRIVTIGGNIIIAGRDTPDGGRTPLGGVSRGTQLGVYTFLEKVVGVRWIMPNDLGEIIPRCATLAIPPLDITEGPAFACRQLEIGDPPQVRQWALRNRIGTRPDDAGALAISVGHSWNELMPAALREAHPEWTAVSPWPEKANYKFCTRRPDAVAAFTRNLIGWLDAHPDRPMVSATASDGQSFCRCERCLAHYEKDPHGMESVTRNILDFYNDVARVVGRERPDHMIGGAVYGMNAYPPVEPLRVESNVFLCWAPLDTYGLGLYKPGYRDEFERVAAAWRSLTPNVGYLNYVHWHRSESGAPLAPAPEIMKREFPALKRQGFRCVSQAVDSNWAYAGPNNWLLAKLMWNADADVDTLYREWLTLAYGKGADAMGRLYALIDEGFRSFKQNHEPFKYSHGQYDIDRKKIEIIYVPRLERMESLYKEAMVAATDKQSAQRIELFGDNMKVFHRQLRMAGYLANPERSSFYLSDEDFAKFIKQPEAKGTPIAWYYMKKAKLLPASKP